MNYQLLKQLTAIQACSGSERPMRDFLLEFVKNNISTFKVKPEIHSDGELHDALILIFGKPETAIFAHMDNIGFTVRYDNELVKIGGPVLEDGIALVGEDSKGKIDTMLKVDDEKNIYVDLDRTLDRGTNLSFKPNFRETATTVQCCYMDNRLGIFSALQTAFEIENGAIVFGCYEEHGGGSVSNLSRWLWEKYKIKQALISDITWVTDGVVHGNGVAISMRDIGIPRKHFLNRIINLAEKSEIPFQLEVEGSGGSDGTEIQKSPYPIDWCFIGAPESYVHSPDELVYKSDIEAMVNLYKYLMKTL